MKRAALRRRDDIGGGAGALGFRKFDFVRNAERGGNAIKRGSRLGERAGAEVAAGNRDAQALAAARNERLNRFDGTVHADRIIGIVALHGVVGQRKIARTSRQRADVIEARDERKGARA